MLSQIFVGGLLCVCNIAVHAVVMTGVVHAARAAASTRRYHPSLFLIGVMIATVSVFMAAHAIEVLIWAFGYRLVGAAPAAADPVYFAFVNYTTLGYGDVLPTEDWKLLGPIAAMNGILLFGWSTAVIFEVLRRAMMQDPAGLTKKLGE
jgi:hypothetical protein